MKRSSIRVDPRVKGYENPNFWPQQKIVFYQTKGSHMRGKKKKFHMIKFALKPHLLYIERV
jgi:hypothetical protein